MRLGIQYINCNALGFDLQRKSRRGIDIERDFFIAANEYVDAADGFAPYLPDVVA